jgi:hypothetical protein
VLAFVSTRMLERFNDHREHIPPHKVWALLNGELEMGLPEHLHIKHCEDCRKAFHDCLQSETFGEALKTLQRKQSA